MKTITRPLALAILAAFFTVAVHAEPAVQTSVPVKKRKALAAAAVGLPVPNDSTVGLLREAYGLLYRADHDYKGHRMHAMHQIEDAARVYGINLRGQGKGDEKQGTSDEQVRRAQSLLEESQGGLAGKPLVHVRNAISQLTIAMKVR